MKNLVKNATVTLIIMASLAADAAPYYRFWRGYKRAELSEAQFVRGLNSGFLSTTIKVGGGRGLVGYVPAILPETSPQINMPNEIALVIYSSEQTYNQIRSTPEGKAYGDSHWDYFDKARGSKSLVPEVYKGTIENEHAYDLLQSDADWRRGEAVFTISKIKGDFRPYLQLMQNSFRQTGLVSYIILVQGDILYEYQLWSSHESLKRSWSFLRKAAAPYLSYSARYSGVTTKQPWMAPQILPGAGANFIF